ncbi:MAG: ornithine cyclodeaminase [Rhodospirillales bacterium]|nr:ornithine cyclodeaminase [Rhodospirillales bacterium]
MTWNDVVTALDEGHRKPRADIGDLLLKQGENAMLNRAAWIPGLGLGLKTVTVFPPNARHTPPIPTIHGAVILYDDETGSISAFLDGVLLTKWKTASDSMLGARYLARSDSKKVLIIGSGTLARSLVQSYSAIFPDLEQITIWSRNADNAEALANEMSDKGYATSAVTDLPLAAGQADMISTATMSVNPVLKGEWITPGTHVDLIGAFRPDMREADDAVLQKGKIFVDSRKTTIHDIGEMMIPIANGIITEADVKADFYDLCNGAQGRTSDDDITVFKNGGGAHLDLMTADLVWSKFSAKQAG